MTDRFENELTQALAEEPTLNSVDASEWIAKIETAGIRQRRRRHGLIASAAGAAVVAAVVPSIVLAGSGHNSQNAGGANVSASSSSNPSSSPSGSGSIMSESDIKTHALAFASLNGDPTPDSLNYVVTTRDAAMQVLKANSPTNNGTAAADTPAVLVVLTGHFTGYAASVPMGGEPPTGTELDILYNATTGDGIGWQLGDQAVDISSLGPVVHVNIG